MGKLRREAEARGKEGGGRPVKQQVGPHDMREKGSTDGPPKKKKKKTNQSNNQKEKKNKDKKKKHH